jgi:hypothetical protein
MSLVAADYPLLQVFLSILYFFLMIIWFFAVASILIDIFRSHDMSGIAKALWFVFVLFMPLIGLLAYLIVRGPKMQQRALHDAEAHDAAFQTYVQGVAGASTADEIAKLADLHERGALTDDEFQKQKQLLLSSQ